MPSRWPRKIAGLALLAACAPPPPEPAAPVVTVAPRPPEIPAVTSVPTAEPAPLPPLPAAPPALPPEDPALGKLHLRVHSPVDGDSHECMLPLIHQVTPLAAGGAWITGGCDMRLRAEGATFTNHRAPKEKHGYRDGAKTQICLANTTFDALWAGNAGDPVVHSRFICGTTSYPIGFRAIERYDGKRWITLSSKLPVGMSDELFPDTIEGSKPEALWGLIPSNTWSLAQGRTEAPVGGGLHRLGPKGWEKAFRKQDVPARLQDLSAGSKLDSYLAMAARGDEVWIAGARLRWNGKSLESLGAATWRWDGKSWTEQSPAADVVHAIAMAADGAVWAASPGALFRWSGDTWAKVELGLDPGTQIRALWAGGAADAWVLLSAAAAPGEKAAPPTVLAHHDGARMGRVGIEAAAEHPAPSLDALGGAGAHVWAWNLEDAWELLRPGETAGAVFTYSSATAGPAKH